MQYAWKSSHIISAAGHCSTCKSVKIRAVRGYAFTAEHVINTFIGHADFIIVSDDVSAAIKNALT